ncbi:centrosomal protein of 192 kda [Plakobranchus ocellatus]|uniref:Centrosomal protein of 192 kDa n=1 Tax=Plakobranchus ocellatus TaxID=259542 RepID=A0AAV3Z6D0_9GAST|nr:centrosomal protein of 192 kda [Plakobranchus ocellatus]
MASDEADHSFHEVALEAEDLEELEEVWFDLDENSSDEGEIGQDNEPEVDQRRAVENGKDAPSQEEKHTEDQQVMETPDLDNVDDAFLRLLQPQPGLVNLRDNKDESLHLDTSIQWGPSIDFGPSINFGDSVKMDEHPSKSSGVFPQPPTGAFNPFDGEAVSFAAADAFGDEEFKKDDDAARAFLDQDEQEFNKENLLNNQELSLLSARGTDETFLNMTIGAYMGTCSERLGSLDPDKSGRPDFGMVIHSPPACPSAAPTLVSMNDDRLRLSPLGGPGSTGNSPSAEHQLEPDGTSPAKTSPSDTSESLKQRGWRGSHTGNVKDTENAKRNLSPVFDQQCIPRLESSLSRRDSGRTVSLQRDISRADLFDDMQSLGDTDLLSLRSLGEDGLSASCGHVELVPNDLSSDEDRKDSGVLSSSSKDPLEKSVSSGSNFASVKVDNGKDSRQPSADGVSILGDFNMEDVTYSGLHEIMERSDMNISDLMEPGEDYADFVLRFLQQKALEKKRAAQSAAGSSSSLGQAVRGAKLSSQPPPQQGVLAVNKEVTAYDQAEPLSLGGRKYRERSEEGASGDASTSSSKESSRIFGRGAHRLEPSGSSAAAPVAKTSSDVSLLQVSSCERRVPGFGETVDALVGSDQDKDLPEITVNSYLKEVKSPENPVFKIPFPVTSKAVVRSKGKQQLSKSRIPRHVASNPSKSTTDPSSFKQLSQGGGYASSEREMLNFDQILRLSDQNLDSEQQTRSSRIVSLQNQQQEMSRPLPVERNSKERDVSTPALDLSGVRKLRDHSNFFCDNHQQQHQPQEGERVGEAGQQHPDQTGESVWSNTTLTEQSIASDRLTVSCLDLQSQAAQLPQRKTAQPGSLPTATRAQQSSGHPSSAEVRMAGNKSPSRTGNSQLSHPSGVVTLKSTSIKDLQTKSATVDEDETLQNHQQKRNITITATSAPSDQQNPPAERPVALDLLPDVSRTRLECSMAEATAMDTVMDESGLHTLLASQSSPTSRTMNSLTTTAYTTQLGDGTAHKFASSTPLPGQDFGRTRPVFQMDKSETSIVPLKSPRAAADLLRVPEEVCMSEVCCVSLSGTAHLPLTNLLPRGVKCQLAVVALAVSHGDGLPQQRLPLTHCPFDLKREVTLAPGTKQNVVVIFRPKDQGRFVAHLKISAASLLNPEERRVYTVTLIGSAEFATLEMSPASEEMDFGDMLWGSTGCKSVRIKNIGLATVPLCFSLFRTDSSLCMFSFHPEGPAADVSSISLTSRPGPASVGHSIFSLSLPGRTEGQEVKTETVKIYCNTQAPDKRDQSRYLAKAEKFQAKLMVCVDQPVEKLAPLATVRLTVNVGLYKLHVDTSELSISAWPGGSNSSTVKLVNSGCIPMPVKVSLEPKNDHFSVSPVGSVLVPPSGGKNNTITVPVAVNFTPQPTREASGDHRVNLMLSNQLCDHYIPVMGRLKMTPVKFRGSVTHLSFGGVPVGQTRKEKFSFNVDNDVVVVVSVKQTTQTTQAFTLVDPEGVTVTDSLELKAVKDRKHTLWVIFHPEASACYSASLVIQELYARRYTIPVSGYGGCSSLHLERVNPAHSDTCHWLDMGHLSAGSSLFRKFVVSNKGSRCCFLKATFCDANRTEYQPTRATVMPSALILPPQESQELLVMFCPSQKEVDLCQAGQALVAVIKLDYGDNIVREMFLRYPGQQPRQVVSFYDIPVSATVREVADLELTGLDVVPDCYTLLKNSTKKARIGLFGEAVKSGASSSTGATTSSAAGSQHHTLGLEQQKHRLSPTGSSEHQPIASMPTTTRPALTQLNLNLSPRPGGPHIIFPHTPVGDTTNMCHTFKNLDKHLLLRWHLAPVAPAYFKDCGSHTVQPAGYSVFKLSPLESTLQPGMTQKISVKFSPQRPGSYNQAWTVVDSRASDKQVHRFIIFAEVSNSLPSLLLRHGQISPSHSEPSNIPTLHSQFIDDDHSSHSARSAVSLRENHHGESDVQRQYTDHGSRRNSARSTDSLGGSSRGGSDTRSKNPDHESSNHSARSAVSLGRYPRGEAEARFHEEAAGHAQTVGPKAYWSSVEPSSATGTAPPRVLSPALSSISGDSSAAERRVKAKSSSSSSSSASSPALSSHNRSTQNRSDHSERRSKGLHLVHTSLEFPNLESGGNSIQKLFIKNQSSQDVQISVEFEPRPPFLIKHRKFKVSAGKMMIFPVTFKPRHVDKFQDKIVFIDAATVDSESASGSARTLLLQVRTPPASGPDGGPESLRSPCCGLAIYLKFKINRALRMEVSRAVKRTWHIYTCESTKDIAKLPLGRQVALKSSGERCSSVRAVANRLRGPGFKSQFEPNQFIIAPPCPPSTKWAARSLKSQRQKRRRRKQWQTTSESCLPRTTRTRFLD